MLQQAKRMRVALFRPSTRDRIQGVDEPGPLACDLFFPRDHGFEIGVHVHSSAQIMFPICSIARMMGNDKLSQAISPALVR